MDRRPAVLLNESAPRSWIRLELLTEKPGRAAIGAAVEVHVKGRVIHRQLKGGGSYCSANDTRLLVGLGDADRVDRVEIRWPDGSQSTVKDPAVRRTHRLREARPEVDGDRPRGWKGVRLSPRNVMLGLAAVAWAWPWPGLSGPGRDRPPLSPRPPPWPRRGDSTKPSPWPGSISGRNPRAARPTCCWPRSPSTGPSPRRPRSPAARSAAAIAALEHLERVRPDTPYLAALVRLVRGKAEYRLARMEEAEASWIEALRIDPKIPEAAWCLLELYYLEGRGELARPWLFACTGTSRTRAILPQFLLELLRQDAQPLAPGSVVQWFEPVLEQNPDDFHANLAMGQNLVREGEADRGLALLERMTREHPDHPDSWDAWLTALDDSGQTDLLLKAIESLPGPISAVRPASPSTTRGPPRKARSGKPRWPATAGP